MPLVSVPEGGLLSAEREERLRASVSIRFILSPIAGLNEILAVELWVSLDEEEHWLCYSRK